MLIEHTTLLENILLENIKKGIALNNPSFISLIKIAKEKNLFFPELYTTFFIEGLHQSFHWECDYVLENYISFGLDLKEAGNLYSEIWLFQSPILNQRLNSYQTEISKKLNDTLKNGFILPEDFFQHYFVNTIFSDEEVKQLKRINKTNFNRYNKSNPQYTNLDSDTNL